MCAECRQTPCHPRCPNAPERTALLVCNRCGKEIYEGDQFFDGPTEYVCESCIEDMNVAEFMEMIGERLKTAG